MNRLDLVKRPLDLGAFRLRGARDDDYAALIDEPTVIYEHDRPVIVYLELETDAAELKAALQQVKYDRAPRTDGLVTTSKVFGFLPRNTIRRDFCTSANLAYSQPELNDIVCRYAAEVERLYAPHNPALHTQHRDLTGKVLPDYRIGDTVFTSGIINKNNPLKYHFDKGNFSDVWSCMLVFKHRVAGGYLSCPQYDVAFALKDNSLLMFDGQQILHGVTPIERLADDSYRYSVVYYSMHQMWNCDPIGSEIQRIKMIKTTRERKRRDDARSLSALVDMNAPVRCPIYIPSRGRAQRAKTAYILAACAIPFTLVVEPHEEALYRQFHPDADYLVLPERDRGIGYARQAILDRARATGQERVWQIDDDLDQFLYGRHNGDPLHVTPNVVLSAVERAVQDRPEVALAAADFRQFARLKRRDQTENTRTVAVTLMRTDTGIDYRISPKEDIDYALQTIAAGWTTLLLHRVSVNAPNTGSTRPDAGGASDAYRDGRSDRSARLLGKLWPDVTTLTQKRVGLDVQIDWAGHARAAAARRRLRALQLRNADPGVPA